jgi:arylsulfatase A-like enzyme
MAVACQEFPVGSPEIHPWRAMRPGQPVPIIKTVPNVLYLVWDDAGIAAWNAFGGLIDAPSLKWLATRGLRYSQWHTAARPAPTRCSLLTGRDWTAGRGAGIGGGDLGRGGLNMISPPGSATLAEIMRRGGYRTYCVGKWDLSQAEAGAMTNSRRAWPLGHGFDRFYGFLSRRTSHWYPDLVFDNQNVDPPYSPAEGYHLTADLADMAVEFIRDGRQAATRQPWLCYLSFGGSDAQAVPREWADAYRGRFDMGYDRYREAVLGNMKRLGVVPEDTSLAPADGHPSRGEIAGGHRPWHSLSEEEKRLSSRSAESYAALCSYTDHQIGRLLSFLEDSGQLDDTIVVACSASATPGGEPGGPPGGWLAGWPGIDGTGLADGDRLAAEWSWAFGTPYNMPRQQALGGTAASPLIISWLPGMADMAGGVRDQYHHAVDIVPTILDCAGIEPPQLVNGHLQAPLPGVSMRYTFTAPGAPSARHTQLYQTPGGRAVYHDGWKAATGASRWELYRVSTDRAETRNVAASYPEKLAELTALWQTAGSDLPRRRELTPARARPTLGAGSSRVGD